MFEFLYILVMFFGIYFLGSIIYPILELIRICLILFRKKTIFRPWFNFSMSFILVLFISIFFGLMFGALRYTPSQVTSGVKDFIGLVFVLTCCLLNFMSILKIYCDVKKIEYNKRKRLPARQAVRALLHQHRQANNFAPHFVLYQNQLRSYYILTFYKPHPKYCII